MNQYSGMYPKRSSKIQEVQEKYKRKNDVNTFMKTGDESPVYFRAINDNRISNREKLERQWREKEDEVSKFRVQERVPGSKRDLRQLRRAYDEDEQLSHRGAEICWYLIYFGTCICL